MLFSNKTTFLEKYLADFLFKVKMFGGSYRDPLKTLDNFEAGEQTGEVPTEPNELTVSQQLWSLGVSLSCGSKLMCFLHLEVLQALIQDLFKGFILFWLKHLSVSTCLALGPDSFGTRGCSSRIVRLGLQPDSFGSDCYVENVPCAFGSIPFGTGLFR